MKTCFKTLMVVVFMLMCSNQLLAFEKIPDAELANIYGGDVWACDSDCLSAAGGCPTRTPCDQPLQACRMCDFAKSNEYCGNWQWQYVGIQCSASSQSCPTGGRIGYCDGNKVDCIGDPYQTNPPACGGSYTDC